MTRKLIQASVLAAGLVGYILAGGSVPAQDKKVPSIKEIMKKGHQGTKALLSGIEKEAKAGNWDDAQKGAALLKDFGEALGKNKASKGSADDWKTVTEAYKKNTESVASAAKDKEAAKVSEAIGLIKKSCKGCHDAHK